MNNIVAEQFHEKMGYFVEDEYIVLLLGLVLASVSVLNFSLRFLPSVSSQFIWIICVLLDNQTFIAGGSFKLLIYNLNYI